MPKIDKKHFIMHPGFYYKYDRIFGDSDREVVVDELSYKEKCDLVWKWPWFLPRIPDPDQRMFDLAMKSYGASYFNMNCGSYFVKRNKMDEEWYKTRDRRRELLEMFLGNNHSSTNRDYGKRYRGDTVEDDIEYEFYIKDSDIEEYITDDHRLIFDNLIKGQMGNISGIVFGDIINDFEGHMDHITNTGYYEELASSMVICCKSCGKFVIEDLDSNALRVVIKLFPDYLYLIKRPYISLQFLRWNTGLSDIGTSYDINIKYQSKNKRFRKK